MADSTLTLVCPACAGMILRETIRKRIQGGLPRMRGDDPKKQNMNLLLGEFAPHARG